MKQLYLLRHAKSDRSIERNFGINEDDIKRPLSRRGIKAAQKVNDFFIERKISIDLIKYSSAVRSIQTYEYLKDSLKKSQARECNAIYTFDVKHLLKIISRTNGEINNLLVIGHNPAMQESIIRLSDSAFSTPLYNKIKEKFPTASLAILSFEFNNWNDILSSQGVLVDFVRPVDL